MRGEVAEFSKQRTTTTILVSDRMIACIRDVRTRNGKLESDVAFTPIALIDSIINYKQYSVDQIIGERY